MSTDLDCPPQPTGIVLQLEADGQVTVRVTVPQPQVVAALLIATRAVDDFLHPAKRQKIGITQVLRVRKELLPELLSTNPF